MDLNDRFLRNIVIGLGKKMDGVVRSDSFNITAASEVMAILCLSRDIDDLKEKISNILLAYIILEGNINTKDYILKNLFEVLYNNIF